jgi:hypothetical protein
MSGVVLHWPRQGLRLRVEREEKSKQEENSRNADRDKNREDQHANLQGASHELGLVRPSVQLDNVAPKAQIKSA